ncbi:pyridoxine/pyridoxamine 5'-phosphate oxidase [Georgenia daeguensis]|uniref:Pyridoxal 5'-phosphate synthase n=1 Tax=Georgenia daeguensis TaxID=908355 RepID=A0ABP8ETX1_9MICO
MEFLQPGPGDAVDAAPVEDLRARLRALPTFPEDLPALDPGAAPDDPAMLFLRWLGDAAADGTPAPHATVLATADAQGRVSARNVILTDLDDDGWHFSTHRSSPKAADLAANPRAALTFFWPAHGRQVRLTGVVRDVGAEASVFLARSEASRVGTLVGHQSEPLPSLEDYAAAYARTEERVRAEPGLVDPDWADHALAPDAVEFFQAARPGNIRLRYRAERDRATDQGPGEGLDRRVRRGAGRARWVRELLWP